MGDKTRSEASLSIDRIDSSKGYIKGNVHIVSWKANRLKSNATLEDLERLVSYLKMLLSTRKHSKIETFIY